MNSVSHLPKHIAIVMDGNGRWARQRFMPRIAGHRQGIEALRRVVQCCMDRGIACLTVFAFSSENWSRPKDEVLGLMDLMAMALSREVPKLHEKGVRLHFPGDRSALSQKVNDGLFRAEELTSNNQRLILNVCFNYGGRWDVCQAAEQLRLKNEPITEKSLSAHLSLAHVSDPDLLIRTGGEMRVSNFLLWQMAYTELFFSTTLWPDFSMMDLDAALSAYAKRERRFGGTPAEQVADANGSGAA